VATGHTRLD